MSLSALTMTETELSYCKMMGLKTRAKLKAKLLEVSGGQWRLRGEPAPGPVTLDSSIKRLNLKGNLCSTLEGNGIKTKSASAFTSGRRTSEPKRMER